MNARFRSAKHICLILVGLAAGNRAYAQVKATAAEVNTGTDDTKFITPLALQGAKYLDQNGGKISAVTDAGANTYIASITPAITGYSLGQLFYVKITTANTGASTLNLNGLGAKVLVKDVATNLAAGDLLANKVYAVYYDGANFQVMNVGTGPVQPPITVANNKLLGRYGTGTGVPQDINLGSGMTLTPAGNLHSASESGVNSADNKIVKFSNPLGGLFKGIATTTGAIKIQLPNNQPTMYAIKGTLHQYDSNAANNRSSSFLITCLGSAMTNGYSATFSGNNAPNYPVRWYTNGATPAIYIGDLTSTWNYVSVTIDEVQASYRGATIDGLYNGWSISQDTAFVGTLAATQLNTRPNSNLNQPLTGYANGGNVAITAADNVMSAFTKLQGQIFSRSWNAGGVGASANSILASDTRNVDNNPSELTRGAWFDFKGINTIALPGGTAWASLITMNPYSDATGSVNSAFRLAQSGGRMFFQHANTWTTWAPWKEIWNSTSLNNINQIATRNYSDIQNKPTTLSGFGITDAYGATNLMGAYGGGTTGATDADTFLNGHVASYYTASWLANGYYTAGAPGYGGLISFPQSSSSKGVLQLNYSYGHGTTTGGGIAFRTQKLDGTFTTWKELWHSGNLNNLSQLATRNFSDLQNKPTTLSGYGITDGATQASVTTMDGNVVHKTGNENISGTKLFSTSIGIATTNTLSYKLAVGGGIIAESIKIKPQSGWADYVFEKDYPLLPLKDLEYFILKHKHLPGIPTTGEVKKEGVDLGEINTKLLQKIEELTLYLIDLKKENETLKKRMDKLERN